jgi:maltose-binding protein MalE
VTYSKELMLQWLQAGAVVPLDDVWAADGLQAVTASAFTKMVTEADGKLYSAPLGLTITPTNFYDTAAFTKAGVTAPSNATRSWASVDEWNSNLDKLKAAGYPQTWSMFGDNVLFEIPFGQAVASTCGGSTFVALGNNWLKTAPADSPKYTDQCVVDGLKVIKGWVDKGWTPKGYPAVDYAKTQTLIESGQAALWQSGDWAPPVWKPSFTYDWVAYPDAKGAKPEMGVGLDSFVVPSGSKNQPAAKAFIAFMLTKSELETGMGRVPARTDVDLAKVIGNNPVEISIAQSISNFDTVPLWGLAVPTAVQDATYQAYQGLIDGSTAPDAVAKAIQDAIEAYKAAHP